MSYHPTIGLEIHAELATSTKMFCSCKNDPDETRPNVNICPICLAHPGTLPVANYAAVRHIFRIGNALRGTPADFSEFDRKSYFYPDIPKGYQISQYEHPFVKGGSLAGVAITRVHLEEDTARSIHVENKSLIDFNRAGVPLMELVTEPVIHDAKTAGNFARELQLFLRTLGAGEANLEKGEMRIEANISVARDTRTLGTKVEVKNLNSFRSVERAIAYEIKRQSTLLSAGKEVVQETRGWDEEKQQTFSQRLKEGSADYRYFPEPDLPKVVQSDLADLADDALNATLPELPDARRARYRELGLKSSDIEFIASTRERGAFFDFVLDALRGERKVISLAANFFVSDLAGEPGQTSPENYADLLRMFAHGELSSRGAKDVLGEMARRGGNPEEIARELNLIQIHDSSLLASAVQKALEQNPKVVAEYRAGKKTALQYLVGQAMKDLKGAGNPKKIADLIAKELVG